MIKVKDVHSREVGIVKNDEDTFINHNPLDWEVVRIKDKMFHIVRRHQSYMVEIIQEDLKEKKFTIKVGNQVHHLEGKDSIDLLLERLGMHTQKEQVLMDMKAPMPGLIVDVLISEGDIVQKGQPMMILEAMKMENLLKAEGSGKVKFISVGKGDRVEKNQVLAHFE